MCPTDPCLDIRPGTHATGKHIVYLKRRTPYIAASTNPFGSPNYSKGDTPFWIDLKKFKRSGGVVFSTNDIRLDITGQVEAGNLNSASRFEWEKSQSGWHPENEVLLKGDVHPDAVSRMSTTSRWLMRGGKTAGVVGMGVAAWDVGKAAGESYNKKTAVPLAKQCGKTAGGFAGAWAGAKAGALAAGLVASPTGPGAIAAGIVGGIFGGAVGYAGACWLVGD
jgi:hypothetical protein